MLCWLKFTLQMCVIWGKWCGCCVGHSLQGRCVWFGVSGVGATFTVQVCVIWGKCCGCYIGQEFTVQVCVVWGKWCGCYIYSAGVCDLG